MPKKVSSSKQYLFALGRRKSSVATIKLFSGKGESTVNGRPVDKYFPKLVDQIMYQKPFVVTDTPNKFHFQAKIIGGGTKGQSEALSLAISRALCLNTATFKPLLRAQGLMTVDSRVRQRRQVGTGGKSRRQKQSPKR
ncbi:30S ribosomal protein S9 [Candidatus Shapirobacteria bacterium RBG_13_44_7]|uniref:30S ribosomal protein S9 n=1 Tax=Candidatus Shapirobacteria bacterium RBG_13_44_7 TaxID=1802149 RepID=A0A1F7SJZ5_9BACT|nr:MAG: 30S ribosomal protein S9 [Candidatus Shapirobacteria bacterium RBG_13_44_7]